MGPWALSKGTQLDVISRQVRRRIVEALYAIYAGLGVLLHQERIMSETEYRVLHLEDNQVNALVVRKMLEACENPAFAVSHADCLLKALDLAGTFRRRAD